MLADNVISSSFSSLTTTHSPTSDQLPDVGCFTSITMPIKGPLGSGCQTGPPVFLGRLATHTKSPAAKPPCIDYPDGSYTKEPVDSGSPPSSINYGAPGAFGLYGGEGLYDDQVVDLLASDSTVSPQDLYCPPVYVVDLGLKNGTGYVE
jgi:hypothetical protein